MRSLLLIRRIVPVVLIALAALVIVRLSFIDGLLRRVTIDGPSMAPAFCGAHYSVTCDDCRFRFPCDAEHLPTDSRAACPNCGYIDNSLDEAHFKPADQVVIDRWPLLWASPARGEVIAVAVPGSSELAVKRIAGLPGERLSIAAGDLFAGESLIRKSAAELRDVRLLVHDNDFRPHKSQDLPPRWRPSNEESLWRKTASGFQIEPSPADGHDFNWLRYEHCKCTADAKARGIATSVTDNDSYNQGETRRPLNIVSDVLLSCRLRAIGSGKLALAAFADDQRFEVEIDPRQKAVLRLGDQILAEKRLKTDFSHRLVPVEFGLCDQQVLLLIDNRTVFRHPYQPPTNSTTVPLHPLAIGTMGIHAELTNLRVWRDLYYLDPQGLSRPWSLPRLIDSADYSLLGDNQPVSIDTRQWEPPTVPRTAILGRVYRPFWTSHRLD